MQYRTSRTQHVAEPHRKIAPIIILCEPGGHLLCTALGPAQHTGRVRGLVGRDIDEALYTHFSRTFKHVESAQNIRLPSFFGVVFKHRQVLQRSRVEDHVGLMFLEDSQQCISISNITQRHVRGIQERRAVDRQLDCVEARLIAIEANEFFGFKPMDLPRDLRPDGSTGTCDKNDLAAEIVGDRAEVGVDRVASQHVGYIELVQLVQLYPATYDVPDRRQDQQLEAGLLQFVRQFLQEHGRRRWNGQNYRASVQAVRQGRKGRTVP